MRERKGRAAECREITTHNLSKVASKKLVVLARQRRKKNSTELELKKTLRYAAFEE